MRLRFLLIWLGAGSLSSAGSGLQAGTPSIQDTTNQVQSEADSNERIQTLIVQGDQLYLRRYDRTTWPKAIDAYQAALKLNALNFEVLWRLSRSYGFIAERETQDGPKMKYGDLGYQLGLRASRMEPNRVEGYYYAGYSLGQYAQALSVATALFEGMDGKCTGLMEKSLEIDPRFDSGGPLMAMGRYYYSCPWPKYDGEKALEYFHRALKVKETARVHVFLAEVLLEEDRCSEALKECDAALAMKPNEGTINYADDLWFQEKANHVRKQIQKEME